MLRKKSGEPQRMASLQELLPFDGGAVPDLSGADESSPLGIQIRSEAKEHIEHAITRLPAPFRMPLILKEILGLPVTDVAEILGVKPATIKTRLHRARHVLRDELTEHLPKRDAPPAALPEARVHGPAPLQAGGARSRRPGSPFPRPKCATAAGRCSPAWTCRRKSVNNSTTRSCPTGCGR